MLAPFSLSELISIAGSVFVLSMQVAILAAVDRQNIAAVLAVLSVCDNIGGSKVIPRSLPEPIQRSSARTLIFS
ncbi:hypothetical protein LZ30DRAFT_780656 [Colletotrichum cereale]|nr:hypothetical protein LZ30DRAFT_780656 [Colletotrichum cereale]